jgi:hypothetical protein
LYELCLAESFVRNLQANESEHAATGRNVIFFFGYNKCDNVFGDGEHVTEWDFRFYVTPEGHFFSEETAKAYTTTHGMVPAASPGRPLRGTIASDYRWAKTTEGVI